MQKQFPEAVITNVDPKDICKCTLENGELKFDGGNTLIIIISYGWLEQNHPDKNGEQLRLIAQVLEWMTPQLGGKRIAFFMYYPSLFQKRRLPDEDDWTPEQDQGSGLDKF